MTARIALLLHMHQPDYRHPISGAPVMPWVRLHACRGYTDVATRILDMGIPATVNVVPSLLDQLAHYASGGSDAWLDLARIPAEEFTPAQVDFVRQRFVHGHPGMRRSPRHRDLVKRAGALREPSELRDLVVWSHLAWMGAVARRRPLVRELIAQDSQFSQGQLDALLDLQIELTAGVLELWARLPSVSVSPHHHPILPLLMDLEQVRRSVPGLGELPPFAWPDDARRQVREGLDRGQRLLGRRPEGMWPSEGAVSPEVLSLVAEEGVRWLVTDEVNLARGRYKGAFDPNLPWQTADGLRVVFRDRELSDRVSFGYAGRDGGWAARDLGRGADERAGKSGAVLLALDGENPWEAYPDAGDAFLEALFRSGRVCGVEELADRPAARTLDQVHTGSWIDGSLAVWGGHADDHRAWAALGEARQAWEDEGRPEAAWPHLRAAEGSDWFWWYGPEFSSPHDDLFDELFHLHLDAAWRAMGREPPVRDSPESGKATR